VVRHVDRNHEWGIRDGSVFGTGGDVCPRMPVVVAVSALLPLWTETQAGSSPMS
jgi:hypothetical protein